MKFVSTDLEGLYIFQAEPFEDSRGNFYRFYCQNELKEIGHTKNIIQMNLSLTKHKGSIRGLHFQYPPKAEIKLVKCVTGKIFDVAVDLRKDSTTYLKWHCEILSSENMKTIYIPEGFAHGFQTMEDNCDVLYLHTEFYSSELESGIRYNEPKVDIKWPLPLSEISERDKEHKLIDESFDGIVL